VKIPPKISIVIPSYNKVKFIRKTFDSIIHQKYSNLEVLVKDGGSTDGTLSVIKEFASKYPKIIKWESGKDNGQLEAVNDGLSKATGDILTFINADDCYTRGTFKAVESAFSKNPKAVWFVGRGMVIDNKDKEIAKPITIYKNILLHLNSYQGLLMTNYIMQPSVFITKKAWRGFGPFIGTRNFIMEYDFWLKIAKINKPQIINKFLSKFRIESNTKSKNMTQMILIEDEKIVKKYTKNPLIIVLHKLNNLGRILIGGLI